MTDRNFAIIVDEAHQSQTGRSARTLRKALIDEGLAIKSTRRWKALILTKLIPMMS